MSYYDPEKKRAMETSEKVAEIKETLEKGEPPKNVQMKHFLQQGEEILEETKEKISEPEAKQVVEQTQEVLGSMQEFLETRNQDEILQRIGVKGAQLLKETTTTVSKTDRRKAREVVEDARNLLQSLVLSANLRRHLLSLISLLLELAPEVQPQRGGEKEEGKEEERGEKEEKRTAQGKEAEKEEGGKEEEKKEPSEKVAEKLEKAQETVEQAKSREPEKVKELEDRMISMLNEMSRVPGLREFRRHLLSLFDYIQTNFQAFDTSYVEKSVLERHLVDLIADVREFLARFTAVENLDKMARSGQELLKKMKEDESTNKMWHEWRQFSDRALDDPNWARENKEKLSQLLDRVKNMFKEETFANPFNTFIRSYQKMITDIQNDPIRVKMEKDLRELFSQLMLDESGRLTLDNASLSQLQSIIVPTLVRQLKYLAIPKFHHQSDTQEFTMRDIFLSVPDLVPDKIHFEVRSEGTIETKHMGLEQGRGHLWIEFRDIELHIKHARVHFKRYSFPKLEDNVLMNTDVFGPNTSIRMVLAFHRVSDERQRPYLQFFPADVQMKLDHLTIKVLEGKHETLLNFLTTVLNPILKGRIEKNVAERIRENLETMCEALTEASRDLNTKRLQQRVESITSEFKKTAL